MLLLHTGGELTVGISTSYNYLIKRPKLSLKLLQALVRLGCKKKKKISVQSMLLCRTWSRKKCSPRHILALTGWKVYPITSRNALVVRENEELIAFAN